MVRKYKYKFKYVFIYVFIQLVYVQFKHLKLYIFGFWHFAYTSLRRRDGQCVVVLGNFDCWLLLGDLFLQMPLKVQPPSTKSHLKVQHPFQEISDIMFSFDFNWKHELSVCTSSPRPRGKIVALVLARFICGIPRKDYLPLWRYIYK